MPSLDLACGPAGPLIQVLIGFSGPHSEVFARTGQTAPAPVQGSFLIDTGASHSVVDTDLIAPLRLAPTGSTPIRTPSTGSGLHLCDEYDVMLYIPGRQSDTPGYLIDAMPVIVAPLRYQGIDGLIGRDVLADCVLIVNGPAGQAVLAY